MKKIILGVAALAFAGCAEATFSAHVRDNYAPDIQHALAAAKPMTLPANGRGMAYLVAGGADRELIGFDLEAGKQVFREKTDVRSRIVVGKGLIAYRQGAHEIIARNAVTGQVEQKISLPASDRFIGVSLDDEHLYYVVQKNGEGKRVSNIVAVDRRGFESWRWPAQGSLGAPSARGGVVAVPYSYQYVLLLDGKTGRELARVRNTDEQITFAQAQPEGFFYGGGKGVYALDEKSASGTKKDSVYAEAKLGAEEVKVLYQVDGYQEPQADYGAFDKNRLHWRGSVQGGAFKFVGDLVVMQSYRYFFAFEASTGRLRWVHAHPRFDVVSATLAGPTLVYVAADGVLSLLDTATGAELTNIKLDVKSLVGATFDAEGLRALGGKATPGEKQSMAQTLEKIIWDPDSRFTSIKIFAVSALGTLQGPDATAGLLRVVLKDSTLPAAVIRKAGDSLVARKDKDALPKYLEALAQKTDYLADRKVRGMDMVARAAAELGAKEAAPLIAKHLVDHETPQVALKDLAESLGKLGGKEAVAALRELLVTYRADPVFITDVQPLATAARALIEIGGPSERRLIGYLSANRHTLPPLAKALDQLLEATEHD